MRAWLQSHPRLLRTARKLKHGLIRPAPHLIGLDYGIYLAEKLAERLPLSDFDCIIGIPRSGLLFASVIATKRGLPLSTPHCFARGVVWQSARKAESRPCRKVLLVEDFTGSGSQLEQALEVVRSCDPALQVCTASVFVYGGGSQKVDYFQATLRGFTVLEWNVAHADLSSADAWGGTCTDLDGVLCMNGSPEEPYIIPNFWIEAIITSRPEAERVSTEIWLAAHGVKYKELIMKSDPSLSSVDHKVWHLRKLRPYWYWESHAIEAQQIASGAGMPVLCFENMKVYEK